MIPAASRLRGRAEITTTVRRGVSSGGKYLVVHYLPAGVPIGSPAEGPTGRHPRVAFAVGRRVGGSVVRHRITRQLRSCVRDRLERLPMGSMLVVRARPEAVGRAQVELGEDLDVLLTRVLNRSAARSGFGGRG